MELFSTSVTVLLVEPPSDSVEESSETAAALVPPISVRVSDFGGDFRGKKKGFGEFSCFGSFMAVYRTRAPLFFLQNFLAVTGKKI